MTSSSPSLHDDLPLSLAPRPLSLTRDSASYTEFRRRSHLAPFPLLGHTTADQGGRSRRHGTRGARASPERRLFALRDPERRDDLADGRQGFERIGGWREPNGDGSI